MLKFERTHFEGQSWDRQLERWPDRTIFQSSAWLEFIAKTQNAEPVIAALKSGTETVGFFIGLIIRRLGLRILGSPFPGWTTSYMGMCLAPNISRKEALDALIRFAFKTLNCVHLEIMDRNLTLGEFSGLPVKYRCVPGFEIDLTQSEETLFGQMSSACRRCIRKADKSGVYLEEAVDHTFADDYYAQLCDVFEKQSLVPPYGVDRVRELIKCILPTGMVLLLRAFDSGGRCIGTGIFPAMHRTMYFWGGASWRAHQQLRPNEYIQWSAIRYWKKRGIQRYDMGGGGEYKRKYGGTEIAVPWIRLSKYNAIAELREIAQRIMKARQRVMRLKHSKNLSTRADRQSRAND